MIKKGPGILTQGDMVVIAHDGIGTQVDGRDRAQQLDAIDDPLAAV